LSQQRRTRRLVAIMFTDMVGFTALGQRDEPLSLALLDEQTQLVRPSLQRYNGREVKTMGDAFLVEFTNALDAVRCACDIQKLARDFNQSRPSDRRIRLRIGLHLGDVEEAAGGDIFGDSVSVASRIEPLAEDGGVCLTRQVYDQVRNKFDLKFMSLGVKSLKNVIIPVEVYKVVMPWEQQDRDNDNEEETEEGRSHKREDEQEGHAEPRQGLHHHPPLQQRPPPQRFAFSSPPPQLGDRTRIAVLPLVSMSPNPGDEYFADGLTEELIGVLSKIRELSVISRTSVMQYKGKRESIAEVRRELRAGTIIEGSVRKAGNRVRVTIQMIDAAEDRHIWVENYDRELEDIFSVQTDIAGRVAEALRVELLAGDREQMREPPTKNTEAHVLYLRGVYEGAKGSPADIERAIQYFESAVAKDPQFAEAYVEMAYDYVGIAGESIPPSEAIPKAKEALEHAFALGAGLAGAHNAQATISFQYDWDWVKAEENFRAAIRLNPSLAEAHDWYGRFMASLGRFDEALAEMRRAYELDPASPFVMLRFGLVQWMAGDNKSARELFVRVAERHPTFVRAHVGLAFLNAMEGRKEEALRETEYIVTLDDSAFFRATQAMVLAYLGQKEAVRHVLEQMLAGRYKGYASPGNIGWLYYLLGDGENGYEWMRRAYDEHDVTIPMQYRWPILGALRDDPRLVDLMRQAGLA
jgi:adenylate cyclase